jgi:hypothetical protein
MLKEDSCLLSYFAPDRWQLAVAGTKGKREEEDSLKKGFKRSGD